MGRPRSWSRSLDGRSPDWVVILRSVPRPGPGGVRDDSHEGVVGLRVSKGVRKPKRGCLPLHQGGPGGFWGPIPRLCAAAGLASSWVPHPGLISCPQGPPGSALFSPHPSSPWALQATHLCLHLCSGPRTARRPGGHGPGAAGGAAGSPQVAPSPGSSRPGAGPWGPAQRLSASSGWCLRWSGGEAQAGRPGSAARTKRSQSILPHHPSATGVCPSRGAMGPGS